MIRGAREIRESYRDAGVAAQYVDTRFREPLGALLHDRQIEHMKRLFASMRPSRVLEIAPGPARLTTDVIGSLACRPVLMDASAQMLNEARRRLGPHAARCTFVQGDVFALPFRSRFDIVYTFRLIRHFGRADRVQLYKTLRSLLAERGVLVFDVVNEAVSAPLRRARPEEYKHYDALLTLKALTEELSEAGVRLTSAVEVQRRFPLLYRLQVLVAPRSRALARGAMEVVDRFGGGRPLEWIATCCRA